MTRTGTTILARDQIKVTQTPATVLANDCQLSEACRRCNYRRASEAAQRERHHQLHNHRSPIGHTLAGTHRGSVQREKYHQRCLHKILQIHRQVTIIGTFRVLNERDNHGPTTIVVAIKSQAAEVRAVARFDYTARSAKELSFRKGESMLLFEKVSEVWWRGQVGGAKGLVPHKYIEVSDTTDGRLETPAESGHEPSPSEEAAESSRLPLFSDSDSEPMLRKRSGSSPVRKLATLFGDNAVRFPTCHTSPQKQLPAWTQEERPIPGIQERRNTLDVTQLTLSTTSARAPGSKLDRQQSDKPITELNKDMLKNMDSVFRELLLSKRCKTGSETPQDLGRVAAPSAPETPVRRSSSGALEKAPSKPGTPSRTGMKARAAALFKSSGGGPGDGTPGVNS
uniref:SLIT-ROBO Rho GTPase-activating protein 3-like n=1 Tax=Pristiophorus japonicus TaxID=55135 RepID=UPI00398F4C8A